MQETHIIHPLNSKQSRPQENNSIAQAISSNAYESYSYSYPHKSAYRPLDNSVKLRDAWAHENKHSLFLYVHIPFCEMRCGFCNLFSLSRPDENLVQLYLDQLALQAKVFQENIKPFTIDQFAIGGGTPSMANEKQLNQLFDFIQTYLGVDFKQLSGSFEVSPQTIDKNKLAILQAHHLSRISIGIQSFIEQESNIIGRPQNIRQSMERLDLIKSFDFNTLNIDLIYGIPGQTRQDWLHSLNQLMIYQPEEVYLYPLYIRELTGIWRANERNNRSNAHSSAEHRLYLYQTGRDFLLSHGYQQVSMRMFQKPSSIKKTITDHQENVCATQDYSCQDDGMFGLGAGARSYTRGLHYSFDYSVQQKHVRSIIENYCSYTADDFSNIQHGIYLDGDEQRRRYIIQSLLLVDGLDPLNYQQRFTTQVMDDFPQLLELFDEQLAITSDNKIRLTSKGIMFSDAIGPWLNSSTVKAKMHQYQLC